MELGLPALLDLAIFEQLPDARFRPVGRLPKWWPLLSVERGDNEGSIDLTEHFPLLELFLAECEPAWEPTTGLKLESDIWSEPGPQSDELT